MTKKHSFKNWIQDHARLVGLVIAGLVVIGGFIGLVVYQKSLPEPYKLDPKLAEQFDENKLIDKKSLPKDFASTGIDPENIYDHYEGNKNSKVTIIEYGDLACSHCAQYAPMIKKVIAKYEKQVLFIYRYFYLGTQGQNGLAAAVAVEAAGRQGKFWEMKEVVYAQQNAWFYVSADSRKGYFEEYAKGLGLDMEQWNDDYDHYQTNGVKLHIDFDHALGDKVDLSGTPTIVINGHKLDADKNPNDKWTTEEDFTRVIERYLADTAQ
jgi:predicted DsbA family dithiol-disulfide isomerase